MSATRRHPFQFHLSTAVVLMVLAGIVVGVYAHFGWELAVTSLPIAVCALIHAATLFESHELFPAPIAGMPEPQARCIQIPAESLEEFRACLKAATIPWQKVRRDEISSEIMSRVGSRDFDLRPKNDAGAVLAGIFSVRGQNIEIQWGCECLTANDVLPFCLLGFLGLVSFGISANLHSTIPIFWTWGFCTIGFLSLRNNREAARQACLEMETLVYRTAAELGAWSSSEVRQVSKAAQPC